MRPRLSRLGAASLFVFVGAVLCLVGWLVMIVIGVAQSGGEPLPAEEAPPLATALILIAPLLAMVGFGLGLAAVLRRGSRKLYAWLGFVLNLLLAVGLVLFLVFVSAE